MSIHYHTVLTGLFGWPGTWGTGGNMVAWVICGVIAFGWLHGKEKARHLAKIAQAQRHHDEAMQLARDHHEALKAHVSQQVSAAMHPPAPLPVPSVKGRRT